MYKAHIVRAEGHPLDATVSRFVGVVSDVRDPNLVSVAGLAPVVALAQGCRLGDLVGEKLRLKTTGGVNAQLKVPALVTGMVAAADSIDDMDLLRHGGMDRLLGRPIRTPFLGRDAQAQGVHGSGSTPMRQVFETMGL